MDTYTLCLHYRNNVNCESGLSKKEAAYDLQAFLLSHSPNMFTFVTLTNDTTGVKGRFQRSVDGKSIKKQML